MLGRPAASSMVTGEPAKDAQTAAALALWRPGLWRLKLAGETRVIAGVGDRSSDVSGLAGQLGMSGGVVCAEQVHGVGIAAVDLGAAVAGPVPGCDGLVTQTAGTALVIRTADCLPVFAWDPRQQAVGIAHAGWRGLAKRLPARLVAFLVERYHSRPGDLWIGIGPAIRSCCYEVDEQFAPAFAPYIRRADGRRTCDLIAAAVHQIRSAGVRAERVVDSGECTACDAARWHSVRRDGESAGRLFSFIAIRR